MKFEFFLLLAVGIVIASGERSKLFDETVTKPCPKRCVCNSTKLSMQCSRLRSGIPQPVSKQASFFSFTNKSATLSMFIIRRAVFANPTLSRDNFSDPIYSSLVDLAFINTNIETIESRAFESLPFLSRLVFQYNQYLKVVQPEAFFGLNLQRLEFHQSPQLQLNHDTIFVESRTEKLVIKRCGLTDFSYNVFHLLLKISLPMKELDLEGNAISTLDQRFWSLFQNISSINLEDNELLCVSSNYWIFTLFRTRPDRFQTIKFNKPVVDLSCQRQDSEENVLFRVAKTEDFGLEPAENTLIRQNTPDILFEVSKPGVGNPAGRSISEDLGEPEYDPDLIDETLPGERPRSSAGISSVNRIATPWNLLTSTLRPYIDNGEQTGDMTTPLVKEVTKTDALFYILIIAGSISFLSIIIGVITSVRRAATWPRHQKRLNAICSESTSGDSAGSSEQHRVVLIEKSRQLEPKRNFEEIAPIHSTKGGQTVENFLNSSVETDCGALSLCDTTAATPNSHAKMKQIRCYSNNMESCKLGSPPLSSRDDGISLDNHGQQQFPHHSSNSTSPLLSASPQGSSLSSTGNGSPAVLLAPLPQTLCTITTGNSKIIRFADVERDECL